MQMVLPRIMTNLFLIKVPSKKQLSERRHKQRGVCAMNIITTVPWCRDI